jgi:tetratricopeptide (TPR) repeat protein
VLDELGEVYRAEGRNSDAEKLFLRALTLREQEAASGRRDPAQILAHPNYLLNLYRDEGRLSDVEPVFERALEIQRRILGPEAPAVGETLYGLAQVYREEGRLRKALPVYGRALQIEEKSLAPDDPRLEFFLNDYANLLQQTGEDGEAAYARARAEQVRSRQASESPKNQTHSSECGPISPNELSPDTQTTFSSLHSRPPDSARRRTAALTNPIGSTIRLPGRLERAGFPDKPCVARLA